MSENTKAAKAVEKVDADYSLEAVPESARKGFWNMFFVMVGFTFFSASMSVGAKLGNGLDLSGFIWACIIGGVILSAYCGVLAFIGASTGMTMDLLCRRAFGTKGSYLSSFLLGFTQIGWFGVGVAMFSIPAAELLGVNEWVLTIIAGLLMTATAATGMKGLEIVAYISVPLIVILGVYSMITAGVEGGGLSAIFGPPVRSPCSPVSAMLSVPSSPAVPPPPTSFALPRTVRSLFGPPLSPSSWATP